MPLLSQTNFPRLWLLMQHLIGGNSSKKELALRHYEGEQRVLEIGCSVGNLSEAFLPYTGSIHFTGIDIDRSAITVAKERFAHAPGFDFSLVSLQELARTGETFDYIIFAAMLHHIDDATSLSMLKDAAALLSVQGKLIISEPEALKPTDGFVFRQFYGWLEQGQFLRSRSALEALIKQAGLAIESVEDHLISPGIVKRPYVARFNLILAKSQ